jgi:hypothetical protein
MNRQLYLLIVFSLSFTANPVGTTCAQQATKRGPDALLPGGIYVENAGKWVMLGAEPHEIPAYHNSKVLKNKKYFSYIVWDSVQVLNGFNGILKLAFQPDSLPYDLHPKKIMVHAVRFRYCPNSTDENFLRALHG